jgi:hypothetical protein
MLTANDLEWFSTPKTIDEICHRFQYESPFDAIKFLSKLCAGKPPQIYIYLGTVTRFCSVRPHISTAYARKTVKLWLEVEEAIQRTGLTKSQIEDGIYDEELDTKVSFGAIRIEAESLDAYARRLEDQASIRETRF